MRERDEEMRNEIDTNKYICEKDKEMRESQR